MEKKEHKDAKLIVKSVAEYKYLNETINMQGCKAQSEFLMKLQALQICSGPHVLVSLAKTQ